MVYLSWAKSILTSHFRDSRLTTHGGSFAEQSLSKVWNIDLARLERMDMWLPGQHAFHSQGST